MSCTISSPHNGVRRVRGIASALLALSVAWACGEVTTDPQTGFTEVQLHANLAGTPATTLQIEVSGPDIPAPSSFVVDGHNGVAAGRVTLPVGAQRQITVLALDANGTITHHGATTMDVSASSVPATGITLSTSQDYKDVHVRLGVYVITVIPEVKEITIGETFQFMTTIVDVEGEVIHRDPEWSTTSRDIVAVDHHGKIEAVSPGVATIAAEYKGTIGLARVFVAGEKEEFFVSATNGSADNPGTRMLPFSSIQQAIDSAAASGTGGEVFVAGGSYVESLALRSNVSVYGGFDPETWLRDRKTFPTNLFGGTTAITGTGVESITVDGLTIWSADALAPDVSSVGVNLIDARQVSDLAQRDRSRKRLGWPAWS